MENKSVIDEAEDALSVLWQAMADGGCIPIDADECLDKIRKAFKCPARYAAGQKPVDLEVLRKTTDDVHWFNCEGNDPISFIRGYNKALDDVITQGNLKTNGGE